jgi:hypothetical protein
MRPHLSYPVPWPVSRAVEAAGFRDSYCEVHPDPAEAPGLTWPAGRPRVEGEWNPGRRAPADRIDFVYTAGDADTLDSVLLGERGVPDVSISAEPWPSDHRAVLSTLLVTPGAAPTLVSTELRIVAPGQEIVARFHDPSKDGERVAIVPSGAEVDRAVAGRPIVGEGRGSITVPSDGWEPGQYDVLLIGADDAVLAGTSLWISAPSGSRIATARRAYRVGRSIEVRWGGTPANRWDWLAIYRRGADPEVAGYLAWQYTGATVDGSAVFDERAEGRWPLPPGRYSVYLLEDDGYRVLAGGNFVIRP